MCSGVLSLLNQLGHPNAHVVLWNTAVSLASLVAVPCLAYAKAPQPTLCGAKPVSAALGSMYGETALAREETAEPDSKRMPFRVRLQLCLRPTKLPKTPEFAPNWKRYTQSLGFGDCVVACAVQ